MVDPRALDPDNLDPATDQVFDEGFLMGIAALSQQSSERAPRLWALERAKCDRPLEVGQVMAIVVTDEVRHR